MPTLNLEMRSPLLVIAGDFNPAIFSMNWIATHLFGIAEGAEMTVLETLIQIDAQALLRLAFVDGVALNVGMNRIDFHAVDGQAATFTKVEQVARNLLGALPHTPVRALGCNFRWRDPDPSTTIVDFFDSPEGIEGRFDVQVRKFGAQIRTGNAVLNFDRMIADTEVQYTFNYHRAVAGAADCAAQIDGIIAHDLSHSYDIMKSLYGYGEYATLGYTTDEPQGEIAHAAEIAD